MALSIDHLFNMKVNLAIQTLTLSEVTGVVKTICCSFIEFNLHDGKYQILNIIEYRTIHPNLKLSLVVN